MKQTTILCLFLMATALSAMTKADLNHQIEQNWDSDPERVERLFNRLENRNVLPGVLEYNRGNYHYEQGEFQEASEYYEAASTLLRRPSKLAENAYNLGNSYSALAQGANEDEAREYIERAINSYLDALEVRPNHMDASHNLELLLREQEQQEQQEDQQNSNGQEENDQQEDNQQEDNQQEDNQQEDEDQQQNQDQDQEEQESQEDRSFGQDGETEEELRPEDFLSQEEERRNDQSQGANATGRIFEVDRDW